MVYRVSFDLAVDGLLVAGGDGGLIVANPRLAELTGYPREELAGMPLPYILSTESRPPRNVSDSQPIGEIVTSEGHIRRKDGRLLPVEASQRVLPGGRLLATIRDISERRRVEESLRRSETRYRALVESQIDLVSRYRSDTILTYVNDAYCKFFGKKREELLGHSFMFMVAPEYRRAVQEETERLARDPRSLVIGEYLNYTQEGRERWIQWVVHSITDEAGQVLELQAVGRDVTQLKQTQEELRHANIVVESSPVVLFRWKAAQGWPVEYVSKNVMQFGYGVDELTSGNVPYVQLVHPDDRDRVVLEVEKLAAGGVDRFEQEYRILTKDGKARWVDDRTAVKRGTDGRVQHYQGILLDITDRKRAEEEQAKLQTQLYRSQRMESVGRLAGGVAHDFNNMLTAILGQAQLALAKVPPGEPLGNDLRVIEQCAFRSAAIVRQLLAFARRQTVAPKVLDLNDTVSGMLKMLRRLIGEDVDIAWVPGAELWSIRIDPSQVDQLLANLCLNARDAIGGVGRITIQTRNVTIGPGQSDAHAGPGDYVMLTVSDDGRGIDKEMLDNIFEPFFTTKGPREGTGLGLATVYGIVKQNEGFINVSSEPGRGTAFAMYLPRCGGAPVDRAITPTAEMPRGRGETVLLVEDERSILDVGKAMLVDLGYRVLTAGTPREALRAAESEAGRIALLVTDVVMPEMDGRALAAAIEKLDPRVRCLYTSGYTADVIAHRGVLDENVHFLQKPFTIRELAVRVREVLDEP